MTKQIDFKKLIMLGTGNALVTKLYNTCFALQKIDEEGSRCLLVDAGGGNGILGQLEAAGIALPEIQAAILTHAHTDHILGMVWVCRMIAMQINQKKYRGEFIVYCHDESKEILNYMLMHLLPEKLRKWIGKRIFLYEVKGGQTISILGVPFHFFDLESTKAKQFGFYYESSKGRVICFGDEPCNEKLLPLMKEAYLVMGEAFCLYQEKEIFKPYEKNHSTVQDIARQAEQMQVKRLLIYHTEESHKTDRKRLYSEEAALSYHGDILVPDDLEEVEL